MLTIEKINNQNLIVVEKLLYERNRTIPEYVQWKYGQNDHLNRGSVAFVDGKPAGCFGLVPRVLNLSLTNNEMCGWFADWYVSPQYRGLQIGVNLLNDISSAYPITFGHPGPYKAQLICKQNGYRDIGFQSRRRMILNQFDYACHRTHNPFTILTQCFLNSSIIQSINNSTTDNQIISKDISPEEYISFIENNSYRDWIYNQPISKTIAIREWKQWIKSDFCIFYAEDYLKSGEKRCLILYTSGNKVFSVTEWQKFFSFLHQSRIIYVDLFTTCRKLDEIWHSLRAKVIVESQVLVKNLRHGVIPDLHGWDRENWTFLASKNE